MSSRHNLPELGSGLSLRPIAAATALHWGLVLT